jgi:hypothetical protein
LCNGADVRAAACDGDLRGTVRVLTHPKVVFANADTTLIAVNHQPVTKSSYVHFFLRSSNGDLTFLNNVLRLARQRRTNGPRWR